MKFKIFETKYLKEEKTLETDKYMIVPGWVWPFSCDKCYFDIEKDEQEVVTEANDNIYHFHLDCWKEITDGN